MEKFGRAAFKLEGEIQDERMSGQLGEMSAKIEEFKLLFGNEEEKHLRQKEVLDILFGWLHQDEEEVRVFAANAISKELIALAKTHILYTGKCDFHIFNC